MTGMEISTPGEILMFPRSHRPQTGPLRSSRKPCPDSLQGMMGEDKSLLMPSTGTCFQVTLARPHIVFDFLWVWGPGRRRPICRQSLFHSSIVCSGRTKSDRLAGGGCGDSPGS